MDSDHFVPIWTVACLEDIKALTTDIDLIVDVLRGISTATLPVFVMLKDFLIIKMADIIFFKMLYLSVKCKILPHKLNEAYNDNAQAVNCAYGLPHSSL